MNILKKTLLASSVAAAFLAGCTTINPYTGEEQTSKATKGAAIGAGVGAVAGILSGDDSRDRRKRAVIGAGVGAIAGGGVGYYMDVQEAKLRQELRGTGVGVERNGDEITLSMPDSITFDLDSSAIKPQFRDPLNSVANVLRENDKTLIEVVGHTDSTGAESYNQQLSERRADAVASFLMGQGIRSVRVATAGYGERFPIASNETSSGRAENRRVELTLVPVTS